MKAIFTTSSVIDKVTNILKDGERVAQIYNFPDAFVAHDCTYFNEICSGSTFDEVYNKAIKILSHGILNRTMTKKAFKAISHEYRSLVLKNENNERFIQIEKILSTLGFDLSSEQYAFGDNGDVLRFQWLWTEGKICYSHVIGLNFEYMNPKLSSIGYETKKRDYHRLTF